MVCLCFKFPTNPLKLKKCIVRTIKILIGVVIVGALLLIAGIVLTALFAKYLDQDVSERVLAIVGIVLLVIGFLVVLLAVVVLVLIFRKLHMIGSGIKSELFGKGKGPSLPV